MRMKKFYFITFIGFLMFAGCANPAMDNETESESMPTEITTALPVKRATYKNVENPDTALEPAPQITIEEPEPEEVETTEVEEPAEEETIEELEAEIPEAETPKVVNWSAFYNRVLQKSREKYECKLPWDKLAQEANIAMSPWMVDAGFCSRNHPKEEDIRKVADTLNVSYEWLLYGDE